MRETIKSYVESVLLCAFTSLLIRHQHDPDKVELLKELKKEIEKEVNIKKRGKKND